METEDAADPTDATRGTPLAWAAVATTLALSILFALIRAAHGDSERFEPPLGEAAFWALFATPGIVGAMAIRARERSLFLAAGASCLLLSVIAFSGVTLPLLVPGLCFLLLAGQGEGQSRGESASSGVPTAGIAVAAALLVLVCLVTIGAIGALVVALLLPLAVQVVRTRRGHGAGRAGGATHVATLVRSAAIVLLVVAAAIGLFGTTETVCWESRQTPAGIVNTKVAPQQANGAVIPGAGAVGGGCDSGALSTAGSAGALALLSIAILVAGQALIRRRGPAGDGRTRA